MSFRLRLALSIAGVVLLALGIGAAIGVPAVRESYLGALRSALGARVDGTVAAQEARQGEAREALERLKRKVRFVAAINEGDASALTQNVDFELESSLQRGPEGTTFFFMKPDGTLFAARDGYEAWAADAVTVVAPLLRAPAASEASGTTLYIPVQRQLFEIIAVPVVDPADERRLGFLALCTPFTPPAPLKLDNGETMDIGLRVGSTLYGTALDAESRAAAERAIVAAPAGAQGASECEFVAGTGEGTGAHIAYARTISTEPLTQWVTITSLLPLARAEQSLLARMGGAALLALAAGIAVTIYLARLLSRPVAEMSAAAVAIEHGDYTVRVAVRDSGELGKLAERFNAMGAGLALRDQYRRVLDAVTDPEVANELLAGKFDLSGRSQDVGVLFCDIREFTTLTEGMEPHGVIEMLNAHMSLLTHVAYEHGGVVDKFVGDLIMVTFGAPKQHGDDAARMAKCALAMIAARARANAEANGPRIEVGIGCAYGTVVAGCMGSERRLEYTVLGERVNLAARLCSKAPAMRVYIDAETKMRNPQARCEPLQPLEVKGFSAPITAFELVGWGERA